MVADTIIGFDSNVLSAFLLATTGRWPATAETLLPKNGWQPTGCSYTATRASFRVLRSKPALGLASK